MVSQLKPSTRLLLGPGPSNVSYRVLRAMCTPLVGHLDPQFLEIMDETCQMVRDVYQTSNQMTFPVSGTGSAGMEASFVNILEPGDKVIIGVNGVFGMRMKDVAARCGAQVIEVEAEWGQPLDVQQLIETCQANPDAKACAVVFAETSTGVRQPLEELGAHLKNTETLFLVDGVTALGAIDLQVDNWGIDICYACTQKGLSVPPGLAPVTFSPKAMNVVNNRKSKVQSWYLDLSMLGKYWGEERVYHHTAPISMIYALNEGLRVILEEGLAKRFERHAAASRSLAAGLGKLGFSFFAAEGYRLPQLMAVYLPDGVAEGDLRKTLLTKYDIEVGGGLGPVAGKIWRIGLLGENARSQAVAALLYALNQELAA